MMYKRVLCSWTSSIAFVLSFSFGNAVMAQDQFPQGFPTTSMSPVLDAVEQTAQISTALEKREASRSFLDPSSTTPVVLATWKNGGVFTSDDMKRTLKTRRPKDFADKSADTIMSLPRAAFRKALEQILMTRLLTQMAKDEGFTSASIEVKDYIAAQRSNILNTLYYNRKLLPAVNAAEDTIRRKIYEESKGKAYTYRDPLRIKEIWLPYVQTYKVAKGDTWTSIAENVCGDPKAVKQFLRDDFVRYLRVPEGLPSAAPREGESLIVPIKPDAQKQVAAKGKKLVADLKAGGDWSKLAAEAGNEAATDTFTPEFNGIEPALGAAIRNLQAKAISHAIETSSGIHIFMAESLETSRTMSFDEVKETISVPDDESVKIREKTRNDVLKGLQSKYPININEALLRIPDYQDSGGQIQPDTVLAEGEGLKYTALDFVNELSTEEKTWKQLTPEERINHIKMSPIILKWLVVREAESLGYATDPKDAEYFEDSADEALSVLAYQRLMGRFQDANESELREYWQANPLKFTQPERVRLHEITKRVNLNLAASELAKQVEKAKKDLMAVRDKITTDVATFEAQARLESQALSTRSRGGDLGERIADFRGDDFRKEISELKVGEVSKPFMNGNEVMLIRLDSRETSGPVPFDKCRSEVQQAWRKQRAATLEQDARAMLFRDYMLDIKVPAQ